MNRTQDRTEGNGALAASAVIALFTLLFFRSVILHPQGMIYSPLSDLVGQTFGWKLLIRDTLWSGEGLVLWNPHLMCGNPVLGNLNYSLLFPMHLLYLLLPAGPAASWTYLLTHFLAAMAAWYFLRSIGIRNWGAVLGALAYGFGVRNLGHLTNGFVGHLETLPFLPLAFAFSATLARQRSWRHAAALALVLSAILLSAFAQIFLYLMFILPLYFAWLASDGKKDCRPILSAVQFTLAVALGCGLAAVHLLPAVSLLPDLSRSSELAPELYRLGSLPLRHFFTLINPELFGRIVPQWSYFGSSYFWTLALYVPILLLPLAFLSLGEAQGRRHRNFFLALIPAILLFAMGTHGPVYDFCHRFVPGVKLFREPARILFFFPLAMAVLAGFGWNGLRRIVSRHGPAEGKRAALLIAASALLVALLGAGYAVYLSGAKPAVDTSFEVSSAFFGRGAAQAAVYTENLERLLPRTLLASLVIFAGSVALLLTAIKLGPGLPTDTLKGLALLIIAADLLFFGRGYLQTADSHRLFLEENPLVERLLELKRIEPPFRVADLSGALSDNQACAFGIDKVGGYDPINLRATQRFFDSLNNRKDQSSVAWTLRVEPGFRRPLLDLANARYLLSRKALRLEGLELVESFEPLPVTLQNYGQVAIPGVRLYRNHRARPRAWFVPGGALAEDPAGGYDETAVSERRPNGLTLRDEFPGPGLLVVSQAWARGWRAEDAESGETLPLLQAYGMFSAMRVKKGGSRTIRLSYQPPGLRAGMMVSAFSLLAVTAILFSGWFARRPPTQAAHRRPVEEEPQQDQHQLVDKGQRVEAQQVQHQEEIHGDGQGEEEG